MSQAEFNIQAKNDFIIAVSVEEGTDKPFEVVDNGAKNKYLLTVSVGEDVTSCKEGDKVVPYGQEFQAFVYQDVQYIVLRNDQVFGVIN